MAASPVPLAAIVPAGTEFTQDALGFLHAGGARSVYVYARGTTTQITVYTDATLTSTLSQPLTTNSNGQVPGYIAAEQQIDVYDVANATRFQGEPMSVADQVADSNGDPGSPVAAINTSTGQINRALRDWVAVTDYVQGRVIPADSGGAPGGLLYTAAKDACTRGKKMYIDGKFPCSDTFVYVHGTDPTTYAPLTIVGDGPGTSEIQMLANFSGGARPLVSRVGTLQSAGVSTVSGQPATNQLTVASLGSPALAVGQYCIIVDQTIPIYGGITTKVQISNGGEWNRIQAISGTGPYTITFWATLEWPYSTSASVMGLTQDTGSVDISGLSIRNLAPGTQNSFGARGLTFNYGHDYRLSHLEFIDMDGDCLGFEWLCDFNIHDIDYYYSHDVEDNQAPYNISVSSAVSHGLINHLRSRYGRHMFTAGGGATSNTFSPQYITISDAIATEHTATSFDTHPGSRKIRFINCTAHNSSPISDNGGGATQVSGFQMRGPDHEIINPRAENMPNDGILAVYGADRLRIVGGLLRNCGTTPNVGSPVNTSGVRFQQSDSCFIGGGILIDSPVGDGIKTDVVSTGFSPSKLYLGDVIIRNPGGYGVNNAGGYQIIPVG